MITIRWFLKCGRCAPHGPHTGDKWGIHSSACHMPHMWPCGHIPEKHSQQESPCISCRGFHLGPLESRYIGGVQQNKTMYSHGIHILLKWQGCNKICHASAHVVVEWYCSPQLRLGYAMSNNTYHSLNDMQSMHVIPFVKTGLLTVKMYIVHKCISTHTKDYSRPHTSPVDLFLLVALLICHAVKVPPVEMVPPGHKRQTWLP